jgi:cyanophycinase
MRPILLALAVASLSAQAQTPAPPTAHRVTRGYDSYLTGNPADVSRVTQGGLQLEGGGTDIPEAFRWLIAHAGGGDIVVIRASGADGYNRFIMDLGPVDSVESIVFHRREASFDPDVIATLEHAEAVFLAGGDQANYVRFWKDTPVQATLNALARRGVPIGGTSAGLAVLGQFAFVALEDTVTSAEALADPYNSKVTLERGFLTMPHMDRVITDSHFVPRDRLGRLLVFLARLVQDGWTDTARAIAVDQEAALLVEADGSATAVGKGPIYFMETTSHPTVCRPGVPLTMQGIRTLRVAPGGAFNLASWSGSGATPYTLSVEAGKVSSSTGALY